ncbi:hypothetical protein [Vulcanisaeta sp. JCM 14467]|uniref:hypothetical protein n=1 Tax=Vulcanisaeta sp. JCM 14467 TaxID=1295370 RepID=UPI000A98F479|nr:hypothetical protein [Vulcanisaeta sp. JCM 14467]
MWQVIDLVIHELYYLAFTALGIALGVLVMNYVMGRESVVRLVDRLGRWVTRLSGLPGYCSLPSLCPWSVHQRHHQCWWPCIGMGG